VKETELVESLRQIKKIFDKHNIDFWLDFGTLLGAVRDKQIIPWDKDIDLGMWREDLQKLLSYEEDFKKEGIELHINNTEISFRTDKYIGGAFTYHRDGNNAVNSHICYPSLYVRKNNEIVTSQIGRLLTIIVIYGIWLFTEEKISCPKLSQFKIKKFFIRFNFPMKQLIYHISTKIFGFRYRTDVIPKEIFEKLKTIKFYDMKVKIPQNVEDYLIYRYGDWKIKDKNFVVNRFKRLKKGKTSKGSKTQGHYFNVGRFNIYPEIQKQE